ncbi:hypothetical protein EON78_05080 [bacterium]|nr:MAG: hypothetical protein EON78_05080 [bacterium]
MSVQKANVNQNQKGLSFLKIADLNFRFSKDYLTAKSYYDSTITTLSKNYPGYDLILKKSVNLKYLTDRYEAISLQDSLQAIALLPTELRETRIKTLANPVSVKKIENTLQADNVNRF